MTEPAVFPRSLPGTPASAAQALADPPRIAAGEAGVFTLFALSSAVDPEATSAALPAGARLGLTNASP